MAGLVVLLSLVLLVAMIVISARRYYARSTPHVLQATVATPVGCFRSGDTGKIRGAVRYLEESMYAPFTGRRCVVFRLLIEQWQEASTRGGGKVGCWCPVHDETRGIDFLIDDGTAQAVIRARKAKVSLVMDTHFRFGEPHAHRAHFEALLVRYVGRIMRPGKESWVRFAEGVIEVGEHVACKGVGTWFNAGGSASRTYLVMEEGPQHPEQLLHVSDQPQTLA